MTNRLIEAIKPLKGVTYYEPFRERLRELVSSGDYPKLEGRLKDFIKLKAEQPLLRYGGNDSAMSGLMKGYMHAHLARSPYPVSVIYQIKKHRLHLIDLVYHHEYEGKAEKKLVKKLAKVELAA